MTDNEHYTDGIEWPAECANCATLLDSWDDANATMYSLYCDDCVAQHGIEPLVQDWSKVGFVDGANTVRTESSTCSLQPDTE